MFVSGKRINKVDRYARRLNRTQPIFIFAELENPQESFELVGFPDKPKLGDTILPSSIGTVSNFNAEGRWDVDKTAPKETRVVGQRRWRWKEFRGRYNYEWQERTVDITQECYPKTFVPPPGLEMTVLDVAGSLRLVTEVEANAADDELKHAINLYLEFFGKCYLTDDPKSVPIVKPKRVNWKILPAGTNPWDAAKAAVDARLHEKSDDVRTIALERQETIVSFDPDEVFVGEGGFADYLAYVFEQKGLVVLESLTVGNAIYIFDREWRNFSQLTKREILANDLQVERIIHATGWPSRLRSVLSRYPK